MSEEKKVEDLSVSELRQIINGESEFIFKINDKVEVTFRELTQTEASDVDKVLTARGIQGLNAEYIQQLGLAKLARALKSIKVNGTVYPAITDIAKVEELLNGLGESIISGLTMAYEAEVSAKFKKIEKKI